MELIKLSGILIVIIGFALRLDSILIILIAAIVTAAAENLGAVGLLETLGNSFISNRNMAIFILIMLVTGTLERNGLKHAAAELIGKIRNASAGAVIGAYGIMRGLFAAFNVSFGGVAGFVRPIVMPMASGAIEARGNEPDEAHVEQLKGMASGMENIAWFFCQVLFVGNSGALLVKSTLETLGYHVELIQLAKVAIPVAVFALTVGTVYYFLKDRKLSKKYYQDKKGNQSPTK